MPDAFELLPSLLVSTDDPTALPIDLPKLAGLNAGPSGDGPWHGLWRSGEAVHRFWCADPPPDDKPVVYSVILPLDILFELRAEAVLRFWRALMERPLDSRKHDLPPQTRARHILILRALDARFSGASYRTIAEVLLGFHGTKADWESDPRKNQVRRLVADGLHYMHGGYRDLLHYPVHLKPQH